MEFNSLILRFTYLVTKIIKINMHLMQILKGKTEFAIEKKEILCRN